MSDVYQSMDTGISLVHVIGHQNNRRPTTTLTPLAALNVRMDALAEHIMAAFILSSATRYKMEIEILEPHRMPSVSIRGAPDY